MAVEAMSWWSRRASQHPAVHSPVNPWKTRPGILSVRRSLLAFVGRENCFLRKALGSRLSFSCTKGVQHSPARRQSSRPPPSPNLMLTRPIERATVRLRVLLRHTMLPATVPPASRVPPSPEGHNIGARKRRTWCKSSSTNQTAAASQPTGWIVKIASWLRLEAESSHTPAGKTLPHLYPKTRFRRERAREECYASECVVWTIP